jgi:hypothetical protein
MYYSEVSSFVSACARIARSFSQRDARDALWNSYINVKIDDYTITFSYGEGGSLFPTRLQFDVYHEPSGDMVSRWFFHKYEGDLDDLPIISPSKLDRVASDMTNTIIDDSESRQEE